MFSMFDSMTRKSWNDSPADSLRTFCSAWLSGASRLDDQVADAGLLDERHLLLRPGADRQHRDDRRDAEDHAQHRQQRPQLVRARFSRPRRNSGRKSVDHR